MRGRRDPIEVEERAQLLAARGVAQLPQRLSLDLAAAPSDLNAAQTRFRRPYSDHPHAAGTAGQGGEVKKGARGNTSKPDCEAVQQENANGKVAKDKVHIPAGEGLS
jgi:hypothetical protein